MELKKISQEELDKIIKNHQHWLKEDCEDWKGMRADLSYVDLSCMNLSYANLSWANLSCSDLSYSDLRGANLREANLAYSELRGANLRGANLRCADLTDADLRCADLAYSELRRANLTDADLTGADLRCANLTDADLTGADLSEVSYNHSTSFLSLQCPEEGSFIGYKKSGNKIVKLRIEEDSKRSSATSRKCRASKVTVLSITSIDEEDEYQKAENTGEYSFTYEVGKTYEVKDFDDNRWNECSTGIHFFITRDEAVRY